ncbi:altered inheritance of mitochondria protein-like protein [Emericellopsis cladophorae]|uniref:Altered inheritance of mitochondria protein-like protein n=1 Tax=Emericellopsis cladophorae TaxID=2686198 RepID=A0A9P9Y3N8_9HYPO|nr:altered inheritance of mitochondria protein-like protein [Emericellopsis cladophorae]KAI6782583.1 altered inheritance of mitochondria protein-like protein [Emericellopsis cladophorae]
MGANESKPSPAHVFKASGPSSVSQDLVDSLQSNHETDASRSRLAEAQIQARVAAELQKHLSQQSDALRSAHEGIASAEDKKADSSKSTPAVNKQIENLRHLLEERKQVRPLPDSVDGARGELVRCLTENDRRPLDCWAEVEKFKTEVKKLEQEWVNKVTS